MTIPKQRVLLLAVDHSASLELGLLDLVASTNIETVFILFVESPLSSKAKFTDRKAFDTNSAAIVRFSWDTYNVLLWANIKSQLINKLKRNKEK